MPELHNDPLYKLLMAVIKSGQAQSLPVLMQNEHVARSGFRQGEVEDMLAKMDNKGVLRRLDIGHPRWCKP